MKFKDELFVNFNEGVRANFQSGVNVTAERSNEVGRSLNKIQNIQFCVSIKDQPKIGEKITILVVIGELDDDDKVRLENLALREALLRIQNARISLNDGRMSPKDWEATLEYALKMVSEDEEE